jgi:alpha-beta hydrolase superfamily lysophospholipase
MEGSMDRPLSAYKTARNTDTTTKSGWFQVCKEYEEDPLNFPGAVRMRTAQQVQVGMRALRQNYHKIALPTFGMHGDTDHCTCKAAHERFMNSISSKDKTLEIVKGGYHELLLGTQKRACFESVSTWIQERATKPANKSAL